MSGEHIRSNLPLSKHFNVILRVANIALEEEYIFLLNSLLKPKRYQILTHFFSNIEEMASTLHNRRENPQLIEMTHHIDQSIFHMVSKFCDSLRTFNSTEPLKYSIRMEYLKRFLYII